MGLASRTEPLTFRAAARPWITRPLRFPWPTDRLRALAASLRQRVACLALGHERHYTLRGDWSCMRCRKRVGVDVPQFPARRSG